MANHVLLDNISHKALKVITERGEKQGKSMKNHLLFNTFSR